MRVAIAFSLSCMAILLAGSDSEKQPDRSPGRKPEAKGTSEQEKAWRADACDYELRFCGHCNTTTDIKEANFFGRFVFYIIFGQHVAVHLTQVDRITHFMPSLVST